ncbi:cell wall hydrolase [Paenibacillus dokdonensis]|uniref:Cell wall hydrolase n=1 Tax=Paenibacillus dokdonensis TaxID=2567944 RepID=A0ABU6GHP3_9BACL|nr:cell wall hydrolase [Paenibacillus dokdonensis]MEC0239265.1 cell wall hydrolase [Paenibacillus dokdonensis]
MYTLRQNRWMALLIGVLLVCFSAICLLLQNEQANKLQNKSSMNLNRFDSISLSKTEVKAAKPANIQITSQSSHDRLPLRLQNVNNLNSWKNKSKVIFIESLPAKSPQAKTKLEIEQLNAKPKVTKVEATHQKELNPQLTPPKKLFFSRTKLLSPSEQAKSTWQYNVSADDVLLLQRIIMAEAEGEPYQGKVAVANVVLNRLRSANFPNTIKKVIYQKYQFSPVANGRFDRVKPNQDSIHAANEALNGKKAVTDDTYYFLSLKLADDLTVHHTRTFEKRIGNHSFYK